MKTMMELAFQKALSLEPIKFLEGKDVRKDVLHSIRLAKKTRRDEYQARIEKVDSAWVEICCKPL